jgi:protein O-GlcNAc transferase
VSEELLALGIQHHRAGRLKDAEDVYQQILQENPQHPRALHLVGLIAHQSGRHDTALDFIQRAIAIDPSDPKIAHFHNNLGMVFGKLNRLDDARSAFQKAIALKSDYVEAHYNLGNTHCKQGRLSEALAGYRTALSLKATFAPAENNLGYCCRLMGEREQAKAAYRRAIEIDSKYAEAYGNLGVVLAELGELAESEVAFSRSLELDPTNTEIQSGQLLALHYRATMSPDELYAAHLRYAPHPARAFEHSHDRPRSRKLRIGYVSPDFRLHSVAYFIEPILEAHDREKFEVFAYSDVTLPDSATARLKTLVDCWRDIGGLSHTAVAEAIYSDRVDVLVDLAGHTGTNRLPVFACKPAPIQVTYLGYPDTTGLPTIDYRITDEWADPTGQTEQFHTEQLIRLPSGFLTYEPHPSAMSMTPANARSGPIAFGSFNNIAKINSEVVSLWSSVLKAVPTSTLLLKSFGLKDRETQSRLVRQFEAQGIAAERIKTLPATDSVEEHLHLYDEIDIALDTFPYCGTTTTCEALFMGVPVITLSGRTHASRVGLSLLSRIGHSDLVATSREQFVEIATTLAGNRDALANLRKTLRDDMQRSSLMDSTSTTRALEDAYGRMWSKTFEVNS